MEHRAEHLIIADELGNLSHLALLYKYIKVSKLTTYIIIQNKIMPDVGADLLPCPALGGTKISATLFY